MNKKISIIVPIYNVGKFLNTCIESIVNQTYKNLEILLINDGSTDNSDNICKRWQKKDQRIIYINQKNSGVSVSRNNGLKKATGEYVSFVDGDDFLEIDMIEKLYHNITQNMTNVAVCDYYTINKQQKIENNYFDKTKIIDVQSNKKEVLEKTLQFLGVPWGKLYLREFLVKNNLQFKVGLKRMQDAIFTFEALELCDKISYLHKPLYNYRIFMNSAGNKYSPDFDTTAREVLKYFKEYLTKNNLWNQYQYLYYTKMMILIIEVFKSKYIPDQCKMSFTEKIKHMKNDSKLFTIDYQNVSKTFLDKNAKIGMYLLKYKLYLLFYIVYKINYKRKQIKYFN